MLAAEALKIMEDKKINGLIIVNDNNQPIGAMNMHDLLKSKCKINFKIYVID
mgnify:CR=1 FL=1